MKRGGPLKRKADLARSESTKLRRRRKPPEWVERARELRASGMTYAEVGREVGEPDHSVYTWLNRGEPSHGVELTCQHCSKCFLARASDVSRGRKFCSRDCFNLSGVAQSERARHRRSKATAATRKGGGNPAFRHGGRAGVRDRPGERRFQSGQTVCQHPRCDGTSDVLHQHHVIYRQHVRDQGGDEWNPDNALSLCARCHGRHHRRGAVLPVAALRDENIQFAVALLGPAAVVYLSRYYELDLEWWLEREYPSPPTPTVRACG